MSRFGKKKKKPETDLFEDPFPPNGFQINKIFTLFGALKSEQYKGNVYGVRLSVLKLYLCLLLAV